MLRLIGLLLPALIPSWRFFKAVGPSPRVEYRLIVGGQAKDWIEDRPRPQSLSVGKILQRLFWNPHWNEQLYLVSLAERLVIESSAHAARTIHALVAKGLPDPPRDAQLQVRVVFVSSEMGKIERAIAYESDALPLGPSV